MGHHFVPQRLLRNFAVPGEPNVVFMYDKKEICFRKVSIKRAAQEPKFYPDEVEADLARTVESPTNPIIAKLLRKEILTSDERAQLSVYVAVMITRVPRYRRKSAGRMPKVLQETVDDLKKHFAKLAADEKLPTEKLDRVLAEIDRNHVALARNPPSQIVEQIRTPWASERIVGGIYSMAWHVFSASTETFITGDAPVHVFDGFGVGRHESEFAFPLSPHIALVGEHQTVPRTLRFHQATPRMIREINRRLVSHAERFVFCHIEHEWLSLVAQKNLLPSRIAWN